MVIKMILLKLFYEFFKTGLFAIGGGAAAIPFLSRLSDKTQWFTKTELADIIAVSESTPGPIGVNMSTYVGFKTAGIGGMFAATIGFVLPSVIIIIFVAGILAKFKKSAVVKNTLYGLRPASMGLIAAAAYEVMKIALINTELFSQTRKLYDLFDIRSIIIFILLVIMMRKTQIHPIIFIVISALIGILLKI